MDEINTTPTGNNDNNQPRQNDNLSAAPQQNANPYGAPQQNANPYAPQQNVNPYAQQGNAYQNTNTQSTYNYDYGTQPEQPQGSPVLGIFSLVLSIIALLCCCVPYGVSIILGIISIILAIVSLVGKKPKKGLSIAGIIISVFAVISAIPMLLISTIFGGVAQDFGMSTMEFFEAIGEGSISEDEFMDACVDYLVEHGYISEEEADQVRQQMEQSVSSAKGNYEIILE